MKMKYYILVFTTEANVEGHIIEEFNLDISPIKALDTLIKTAESETRSKVTVDSFNRVM